MLVTYKKIFFLKKEQGFTLLELLIVIFLVTLTVGIGSIFLASGIQSKRINSVARELSATIRQANTLARINGETKILVIDMDGRHYGLEKGRLKKIPDEIRIKIIDPIMGELTRGKYSITFEPFGNISPAAIVLYSNNRSVKLEMDPIIGAVLVK